MKNILIIFVFLHFLSGIIEAQTIIGTTFKISYGDTFYLYDGDMNKIIHRYQRNGWVFLNEHISISPDNRYVAAITQGPRLMTETAQEWLPFTLFLFDINGNLKMEVEDVIRYVWSPNSKEIAYVKARGNGESYMLIPQTLCIITLETNKTRIFAQAGYADLTWAIFDSMIYYYDYDRVYRVDPKTGEEVETPFHGIHFSDDGRYYFTKSYEGSPFRVFDRSAGVWLKPENADDSLGVGFSRWLPGSHKIIFGKMYREKYVYDVDSKRTLSTFDGIFLGYKNNELIYHKDKFYFPELKSSKIQKLNIAE